MALYRNFTYSEEPSYALDFICKKELGKGKIEYEGNLNTLFRDDINRFIDYNLRDVEIIEALEAKLKFIGFSSWDRCIKRKIKLAGCWKWKEEKQFTIKY